LLAIHVAAYAGSCLLLTRFAVVGTSRALALGVTIGAACISLVFSGSALLFSTDVGDRLRAATPATLRAAIRGGTALAATMAVVSAGLVAGATLFHAGRALELTRALGATLSGLPVAILNALSANAVAARCVSGGPGFALDRTSTSRRGGTSRAWFPTSVLWAEAPGLGVRRDGPVR
jgi:hypothetical protein